MKRKLLAAAAVLAAMVGCRTLVGIDDLSFQQAPPDGGNSGAGDQKQPTQDQQATILQCADAGTDCRQCCKTNFTALRDVFDVGEGKDCICKQCTACITDSGTCDPTANPPAAGALPGPGSCVNCEDLVLSAVQNGACNDACDDSDSKNNGACSAGLNCLQHCPIGP